MITLAWLDSRRETKYKWFIVRGYCTFQYSELNIHKQNDDRDWVQGLTLTEWGLVGCIGVRSRRCGCLVTWFCYQLIAKPGNETAAPSWPDPYALTHWGRVTHICVVKLAIIGSDNGLLPGRRQAIIWTNAGILLIGPLGTNFIEILIGIQTFLFKKMHLKMSSAKWRPFCLGLNVLMKWVVRVMPVVCLDWCLWGTKPIPKQTMTM